MVPKSGCVRCRKRHIRCVLDKKSKSCKACDKSKKECVQDSFFRFKLVESVSQRLGGNTSTVSLAYGPQQKWLPIPEKLDFVSDSWEPLDEGQDYLDASSPQNAESQSPRATPATELSSELGAEEVETNTWNGDLSPETYNTFGRTNLISSGVENNSVIAHGSPVHTFPTSSHSLHPASPQFTSPHSQVFASPHSQVFDSPSTNSFYNDPLQTIHRTGSSSSSQQPDLPCTDREAFLLRHYIEQLSPWADACDPLRHFATVVPQRAVDVPLLLYAVLAFSAKVLDRDPQLENPEASTFYTKSLSLLIPILSDSHTYDENVLAAVVLLRMYEERNIMDERCHLLGQSRLLNSMAEFSHCGGLGEAASWVSLRQDIYISMVLKQPISIDLKIYEKSQSFEKRDDGAWANVMVYLFARVLALALSPSITQSSDEWQDLEMKIEEWNATKPKTFYPISIRRPVFNDNRRHREVWMLNSFHVVGVQYYYLAKIFLTAYKPRTTIFGFGAIRERREYESSIAANLGIIIGLAFGNPLVQNCWFTTSHILSACGCYLRDQRERLVAIEFLQMMEQKTGWRTSAIASSLQQEWNCLDNAA